MVSTLGGGIEGVEEWLGGKEEEVDRILENWVWEERRQIGQSPLDSKEIKPVNPKGNQPWIFIGRTEAEAPILWPPDVKSRLTGKDPDAGKDWRQEEKGMTEDEMVGWHHWFNGHESEQTPGDSEGQRSLDCCSPWAGKESDSTLVTEQQRGVVIRAWGSEDAELSRAEVRNRFLLTLISPWTPCW